MKNKILVAVAVVLLAVLVFAAEAGIEGITTTEDGQGADVDNFSTIFGAQQPTELVEITGKPVILSVSVDGKTFRCATEEQPGKFRLTSECKDIPVNLAENSALAVEFKSLENAKWTTLDIWAMQSDLVPLFENMDKDFEETRLRQFIFKQPYSSNTALNLQSETDTKSGYAEKKTQEWKGLKPENFFQYIEGKNDDSGYYVLVEQSTVGADGPYTDSELVSIQLSNVKAPAPSFNLRFTEVRAKDNSVLKQNSSGLTSYSFSEPREFKLKIEGIDIAKNLYLSSGENSCSKVIEAVKTTASAGTQGETRVMGMVLLAEDSTAKDWGEAAGTNTRTAVRTAGTWTGRIVNGAWIIVSEFGSGFWEGVTASSPEAATTEEINDIQVQETQPEPGSTPQPAAEPVEEEAEITLNEKDNVVEGKFYPVPTGTIKKDSALWKIAQIDGVNVSAIKGESYTFFACQESGSSYKEAKITVSFPSEPGECSTIRQCLAITDKKFVERLG